MTLKEIAVKGIKTRHSMGYSFEIAVFNVHSREWYVFIKLDTSGERAYTELKGAAGIFDANEDHWDLIDRTLVKHWPVLSMNPEYGGGDLAGHCGPPLAADGDELTGLIDTERNKWPARLVKEWPPVMMTRRSPSVHELRKKWGFP